MILECAFLPARYAAVSVTWTNTLTMTRMTQQQSEIVSVLESAENWEQNEKQERNTVFYHATALADVLCTWQRKLIHKAGHMNVVYRGQEMTS